MHVENPPHKSQQQVLKAKNKGKTVPAAPPSNSDSDSSEGSKKGERAPTASKESGYARRNPSKETWKATPKWYVVLAGRQVGIYRDWNHAKGYVVGYSNAFYRGFHHFG